MILTICYVTNRFGIYQEENIITSFSIFANLSPTTSQYIFGLPIENYKGEEIIPDTSFVHYHQEIILNNTNYSGLYSRNYNKVTGIIAKEEVYFHPFNGLIAVRDSLGTLWTKL